MGRLGDWRQGVHRHLARVPSFVHILMKPRNREAWTPEDRALLRQEVRALARWTPALFFVVLPGGLLLLPAYIWLLDRRRKSRAMADRAGARE